MPRFTRTPFSVSAELNRPDEARLVLHGELDLATTPLFVESLLEAERSDSELLLLDMGGLTFIDVAGLSAILAAARRAARVGRRIRVSDASAPVRRLFELTAIDQAIELAAPVR